MRKKSHLALAGFLIQRMDHEVLNRRWRSFYFGNILPDCKPSFVTVRHEYDGTFDMMAEMLRALVSEEGYWSIDTADYMMDLGQVFHYIADYFTFPHNQIYDGNLKDHCMYEKELKFRLREYVKSGKAFRDRIDAKKFETPEAVCSFVKKAHEDYLKMKHGVQEDCEYIVRICHQVVQAILNLENLAAAREAEKRFCPA